MLVQASSEQGREILTPAAANKAVKFGAYEQSGINFSALSSFTPFHRFLRDEAQLNLNDQCFKICRKYFKFCLSAARLVFAPCPG